MSRRTLGGLLLLALTAAACSVSANALDGDAPDLAVAATPVATLPATTLTVHGEGAEPRTLLASLPRPGTTQTLEIVQTGAQRFTAAGETFDATSPTVRLGFELTVTDRDEAAATVDVRIAASTATVADDVVVDAQAASLVRGMDGSTTRFSVLPGGTITGPEPVLPNDDEAAGLVLGWFERNPISVADGIPPVPLGVGASWTIDGPVDGLGVPVRSTRTYEITDITDTAVTGVVHRRIVWPPGDHGGTTILGDSTLTGSGTVTWHRDGIVGVTSFDLAGAVAYDLGAATLRQDITTSLTTSTEVVPAPPPSTTTVAEPPPTTVAP